MISARGVLAWLVGVAASLDPGARTIQVGSNLRRVLRRGLPAALCALLIAGCASEPRQVHVTTHITTTIAGPLPAPVRAPDWRAHFKTLDRGAILVDLTRRRLHYWGPGDDQYRSFPIGVPASPELARTGTTRITRRAENPVWRPTASQRERQPNLPRETPPGPDNPMGAHALYLDWPAYAIHGTNTPASIGRATTSGCIRLFAEHIEWLFEHAPDGAPVTVIGAPVIAAHGPLAH